MQKRKISGLRNVRTISMIFWYRWVTFCEPLLKENSRMTIFPTCKLFSWARFVTKSWSPLCYSHLNSVNTWWLRMYSSRIASTFVYWLTKYCWGNFFTLKHMVKAILYGKFLVMQVVVSLHYVPCLCPQPVSPQGKISGYNTGSQWELKTENNLDPPSPSWTTT